MARSIRWIYRFSRVTVEAAHRAGNLVNSTFCDFVKLNSSLESMRAPIRPIPGAIPRSLALAPTLLFRVRTFGPSENSLARSMVHGNRFQSCATLTPFSHPLIPRLSHERRGFHYTRAEFRESSSPFFKLFAFRLSPSLSLSHAYSLAGVHWTILRAGFAAVKMMEWPAEKKKRDRVSSAVRIISSLMMVTSFRPLVRRPVRRATRVPVWDRRFTNHETRGITVTPSEIKRASKSALGRKLARERREMCARVGTLSNFPASFHTQPLPRASPSPSRYNSI